MGCDMHVSAEVKINGVWHSYANALMYRNYRLFAKIAGVRNSDDLTPISKPRGCPDDATVLTKLLLAKENGDAHSITWLSAKEIHKLEGWAIEYASYNRHGPDSFEDQLVYFFGNSWFGFIEYPEDNALIRALGVETFRWIIWFDC